MIREAVAADIPRLVEMGRRFIRESSYRGRIGINPNALRQLMGKMVGLPSGVVFVSENDGKAIGMVGVHVYDHPMSGELFANELFWWVEPEERGCGMKLKKRAEAWARAMGAVRIQMTAPNDRIAQVYRASGYYKLEELYQRDL